MNYRYKISGENLVLSKDEHEAIQKAMDGGRHAVLRFRNNALMIDTSKITFCKETENLTEEQEKGKILPNLPPANGIWCNDCKKYHVYDNPPSGAGRLSHDDFWKKMGWEHSANCLCKVENPKNRARYEEMINGSSFGKGLF
jgi:hypothetical protein